MATFDLGTYGAEIIIDDSKFTKGMDNAEKSLGKTDSKAKKFGSGLGKLAIGSVAGLGAALLGVGTVGTKMAMDLQGSLNSLKVATGATEDEMKDMESSLSNLYNSGFGESFQDIADS
ncbi:hypothetical protein, partial [Oceanobacillus massiliensis]|uniref:hypothetical protein n=1 Tax=Oceanobacillus massiliensis TaxID=1465765 RepID=UPI0030191D19